jgi:hypothetical protein
MAIAMMLYAITGFGQVTPGYGQLTPITPTINVPAHPMLCSTWDQTMPAIAINKNDAALICSFACSYHANECTEENYQGYWYQSNAEPCLSPCTNPVCSSCQNCTGDAIHVPNGQGSWGCPSVAFDAQGNGYMMGMNESGGFFNVSTTDDGATWGSTYNNWHLSLQNK